MNQPISYGPNTVGFDCHGELVCAAQPGQPQAVAMGLIDNSTIPASITLLRTGCPLKALTSLSGVHGVTTNSPVILSGGASPQGSVCCFVKQCRHSEQGESA